MRDRLEIIEISSYTEQEKLEIAKRHLLKKERELYGLKAEQLNICLLYTSQYFKSEKKLSDFYCSYLKIPLAGATLPVIAFLILGLSQGHWLLVFSTIILGIGHIGIHLSLIHI